MKKVVANRVLFASGCVLLAVVNWPLITLVNRIEPFIWGLPFFVFVTLVLNLLVALLLFVSYRVTG